jgi:hypothetical protein
MISKNSIHWSIFEKVRIDLREIIRYINGTVIDMGCGAKPFRNEIEKCCERYIGIDIPSKIRRPCNSDRSANIDIFGDCFALPVKSSSVETVFPLL